MKPHVLNLGVLTETGGGIGRANRVMVNQRAHEIAFTAGRRSPQVTQLDYEQAKRELTGESDSDRQDALLDALPEAKHGSLGPDALGMQTAETAGKNELKHDS